MPKVRHTIRVDEADLETWKQAAEKTGYSLSEWIRRQCNLDFFREAVQNTAKHFGLEGTNGQTQSEGEQGRELHAVERGTSSAIGNDAPKAAASNKGHGMGRHELGKRLARREGHNPEADTAGHGKKSCPHGIEKGGRCTLCFPGGGIVK